MEYRSWVEIDLEQLIKNYRIYKQNISENYEIMAVVKANAYGHGDIQIARRLQEEHICAFAVATAEEAIRLRKANIRGEILVLGFSPVSQMKQLKEYGISQAICSKEHAKQVMQYAPGLKVHIAVDTGMNRIGIDAELPEECEKIIRECSDSLDVRGIFTHLCVADGIDRESKAFTKLQLERFVQLTERIKDLKLPYIHCMNSAGGLFSDETYGNMVRLGIILYGLKPDYSNQLPEGIESALKWKSRIGMLKVVHRGETIGYGRTFQAKTDMKVATITTGYADGYRRELSNKGYIFINGEKAPILGRICMDQFMVDVSGIDNVTLGMEVTLLGEGENEKFDADDMGNMIGTIGYEIVCGISERVERVYII